ncbi:hypothetical protein [[Phormidium] sp. ETS-05]|uniref:hypothetical protein n=1 Tax=[Phormidium] sp. ETS-05 TaxID=222819 RepID=UPI0018EEF473|nr:hypothetical protein [[Phormidium] sp. ETS-05]
MTRDSLRNLGDVVNLSLLLGKIRISINIIDAAGWSQGKGNKSEMRKVIGIKSEKLGKELIN